MRMECDQYMCVHVEAQKAVIGYLGASMCTKKTYTDTDTDTFILRTYIIDRHQIDDAIPSNTGEYYIVRLHT